MIYGTSLLAAWWRAGRGLVTTEDNAPLRGQQLVWKYTVDHHVPAVGDLIAVGPLHHNATLRDGQLVNTPYGHCRVTRWRGRQYFKLLVKEDFPSARC